MLGVIQEQHAERCRLFQQWKGLDFPVVQDMLNTNGIAVVPVYVAIDEHGIVRGLPRRADNFIDEFLKREFPAPKEVVSPIDIGAVLPSHWEEAATSATSESARIHARLQLADCLIQWSGTEASLKRAIGLYRGALESLPQRSDISFRLGCAYRSLYEKMGQRDGKLFNGSVASWEQALERSPNQYIYRRRIEQYGPRLRKPYSFYDWVSTARTEIRSRGEQPVQLTVEPNGAELADRAREMLVDKTSKEPDPDDEILPVAGELISAHANLVPSQPTPGDVVAVHVVLNVAGAGKWNHESTPLEMWIDSPTTGITLSSQLIRDRQEYSSAESIEPVSLSFEIQLPEEFDAELRLTGYCLFNVCESEGGQCLFRRKDIEIAIPIGSLK